MRILISAPYFIPVVDQYRPEFERLGLEPVVVPVKERLSEAELMEFAGQVDGAICGDDRYSEAVLQAFAPRLKAISKWGTGVDSIDREAAKKLGIPVFNTPDAFTGPVADSVMSYLLSWARQTPWLDRDMKQGRWDKRPARSLAEIALGVVGVGRIGKAVLRRAGGFDMPLMGNDVVEIDAEFVAEVGVEMLELPHLLERSDVVSLNCDLNPSSHHLIDAAALEHLRPGAFLINTARGPIIDEPALVSALQGGRLAGAALDVFEEEPLPADSPLREMDNVLLAPHNANASHRAWERVHRNTVDNLIGGLGLAEDRS